jgi:hypothetical protein
MRVVKIDLRSKKMLDPLFTLVKKLEVTSKPLY